MKKITTSLFALVLSVFSYAQITLDASDFGVIGDSVVVGRDTLLNGISLGTAGANQTWDYSSFVIESYNVNHFIDPSATTNGASFPLATVAYQSTSLLSYLSASASSVQLVGLEGDIAQQIGADPTGIDIDIPFSDNQTLMEFPANYNDVFSDVSTFDKKVDANDVDPTISAFVDSIQLTHISTSTHTIDAYGTLILLNDTQEVLRKLKVEYLRDTIRIKTATGWAMPDSFPGYFSTNPILDTLISYEYFAKGRKYPVTTINVTPQGDLIDATFLADSMLIVDASVTTNILCNGENGGAALAEVVALGTPPYTYVWSNSDVTASVINLTAGSYFVTVTDANGKLGIANVQLTEPSVITVEADVDLSCDACSDGTIELIVTGGAGSGANSYDYLWSIGATTPNLSNLAAATYEVTVTDVNGCEAVGSFEVLVEPLGLGMLQDEANFKVYPNPTKDYINIKGAKHIQIYDLLGAKVYENTNIGSGIIDLSGFEKGIYFVNSPVLNGEVIRLIIQ